MIFVTGAARSGTSLITKILKAHGCHTGEVNVLYENLDIRQKVLKPYLRSLGCDPLGQKILPDTDNLIAPKGLRDDVLRYLPDEEPKLYKDAKLTLVWTAFAQAFPDAKWVLVRRDKERIIDSCVRTSFMWSYSKRSQWAHWVEEHEHRFEAMKHADLELCEVWPDHIMDDPESFACVAEFLDLPFNQDAVDQAIDRTLWHGPH